MKARRPQACRHVASRCGGSNRVGSHRSAWHPAAIAAAGFRPSASLHRSAPRSPSRRRRLGFAALAGGTVVAVSSGLAPLLASGAYAAPPADRRPAVSSAADLAQSELHEQHLAVATAVGVAAQQRVAAARRVAAAEAAQQAARRAAAASRSQQRAALTADSFTGLASWYGPGFNGRRTASGARYDQDALTAASRTLPLGTRLRVCHAGACVTVLINDRGPAPVSRVLDLSRAAAQAIGVYADGVGEVTATVVG